MRYGIKSGRFGSYFYDLKEHKELDLFDVLGLLEEYDRLKNQLKERGFLAK